MANFGEEEHRFVAANKTGLAVVVDISDLKTKAGFNFSSLHQLEVCLFKAGEYLNISVDRFGVLGSCEEALAKKL